MRTKTVKIGLAKWLDAFAVVVLAVVCACTFMLTNNFSASAAESAKLRFDSDYASFVETEDAADKVNAEIAKEGTVLLKNNGALPFKTDVKRISIFGKASVNIKYSGGSQPHRFIDPVLNMNDVFERAGYQVNKKLESVYASHGNDAIEPAVSTLDSAKSSFDLYNDAALVVFTRASGEGADVVRRNAPGHSNPDDHALMLQDNEKALISEIKQQNFKNIIVLINSANAMQLTELEDDDDIDGIVLMSFPGLTGLNVLPDVLSGKVNPSGKLVDVYAADFTKDPTYQNFGDNSQLNKIDGKYTANTSILDKNGQATASKFVSLDYEEGIYMGYNWYETAWEEGALLSSAVGYDAVKGQIAAADSYGDTHANYEDIYYNRSTGVVYPFGYGQSYTNFEWTLDTTQSTATDNVGRDSEITLTVNVKNTGTEFAGKDVVQVYYSAPYYDGIEKSAVSLVEFAKTDLIAPGETDTVTIKFPVRDMAEFDYNDANGNGFYGYELEAGTYEITLRSDSHNVKDAQAINYTVPEAQTNPEDVTKTATAGKTGFVYREDEKTGYDVNAVFSQADEFTSDRIGKVMADPTTAIDYTTRKNLKDSFPETPTVVDLKFSDWAIDVMLDQPSHYSFEDNASDPWYVAENSDYAKEMTDWTQGDTTEVTVAHPNQYTGDVRRTDGKIYETQLVDMIGNNKQSDWDKFMNQLTWNEMVALVSEGWRYTPGLASVGKPVQWDQDGPGQVGQSAAFCTPAYSDLTTPGDTLKANNGDNGYAWACATMISQTWNRELAYEQGRVIGNESLFLNTNGWYGPGANIHRSPFSGRNHEYYSQDGVQGGIMCAGTVKGATDKGMHMYLKHFALNDQETNRTAGTGGVSTWCNEQAMRQIYFKAFELPVKDGNCNGMMTSYNRIGLKSSDSFRLMTTMTRNEWGMYDYSITDRNGNSMGWTRNMLVRTFTLPLTKYTETAKVSPTRYDAGRDVDGVWDDTTGCVMIAKDLEEFKAGDVSLRSDTQWYWVRKTAETVLRTCANSNAMDNGTVQSSFGTPEVATADADYSSLTNFAAKVGDKFTQALADSAEKIGASTLEFNIVNGMGELPSGLSLNGATGVISGTPAKPGAYSFRVEMLIDSWIRKTCDYTLIVGGTVSVDHATATAGEDYIGTLASEMTATNLKYSAANLPTGLTMDATGKITGTPETAGTYFVDVIVQTTNAAGTTVTGTYYDTVTITVAAGEDKTQNAIDDAQKAAEEAQKAADDAQKAADAAKAKSETLKADLDDTNNQIGAANTLVIVGLVVGIVGVIAAAGAIVLCFFKKKS